MVLPPEDTGRNKLSRKSQKKALERALQTSRQRQAKASKKKQSKKKNPSSLPVAKRGGFPIHNAPSAIEQLEHVNLNAAGIDLASTVHVAAVPEGRDPESSVRSFGTFTADLEGLADWLSTCGITTVAMESTGVYWIPLYELLQRRGFEVLLVNATEIKKFRRKSDVLDCQWIQTLHTFGLLRGSFRPADKILEFRNYMRHRDNLVKSMGDHVRRMQKSLQQMNLKLTEVISDITGVTGMRILNAILRGERDPHQLAKLRDERCKNDETTIALALQGNWREEHLYSLGQSLELYEIYREKLSDLDKRIEAYLNTLEDQSDGKKLERPQQKKRTPNEPSFDTRNMLYRLTGVDLTSIDGISGHSGLQLISEIGTDMSAWPTEKHFVSWLCLCPEVHSSGGRRSKNSRTHPSSNRAAATLRMCAQSLFRSQCALGAFGRRLRAKKGGAVAVTAMARKLAVIIYNMIKYGRAYVDRGEKYYEQQYHQRVIKHLRRRAASLGFSLTPTTECVAP